MVYVGHVQIVNLNFTCKNSHKVFVKKCYRTLHYKFIYALQKIIRD